MATSEVQTPIDFVTLGMFIIDEIHFQPPTPPVTDIVGGAGSYAALGARLLSPPPASRSIGWVVDCGSDFPPPLQETIRDWKTSCLMRETPHRLTTRGWNGYTEGEHRAFRYTTPKLRLDHDSLTPKFIQSKSFHLICSAQRCIELVRNILRRRQELDPEASERPPVFIWEPVPDLCTPAELQTCLEALKMIDVVSPNHAELGGFFGRELTRDGEVDKSSVQECVDAWLKAGVGASGAGAVVVRCGKEGCYAARATKGRWFPAYHQSADRVVDPTGGGNTFLGGFAVGLVRGDHAEVMDNLDEAVAWGSVAASFAIEQVGMPTLRYGPEGGTWNGVDVFERLREFRKRLE